MAHGDTIAAVATPPGMGGIGVVRVSGPRAVEITHLLFRSAHGVKTFQPQRLYHGHIVSQETGKPIDEVLIAQMKGPRSYTGEDTLEISCHGGTLILATVLDEVIKAGARPALPGEFTKRAFLNNRIDLSQAEAALDLTAAKTAKGLETALSQLRGDLARRIASLRSAVLDVLADLEVAIDFSEDEGGEVETARFCDVIDAVIADLRSLISTHRRGNIYRQGLQAVITGRANVGKSSLLNRLLGEKRAIVTPIPGTTRDFIEECLDLGGIPVRLTDTAGIRRPENIIEEEGIRQVWEKLTGADVVIIVLDGSETLTSADREIIAANRDRTFIIVINKSDLPQRLAEEEVGALLHGVPFRSVSLSAKYGDGVPDLIEAICAIARDDISENRSEAILTNVRHKVALEKALNYLVQAREAIVGGFSPEFAACDAKEALDSLDEIGGIAVSEDVLDRIFSRFCIGK